MNQVAQTRLYLSVALVAILVAGGYEMRLHIGIFQSIPTTLLVVVSLSIGVGAARAVVSILQSFTWGRFLLMRRSFIEGHWLLKTYENKETTNNIRGRGIIYFTFCGPEMDLNVTVYRPLHSESNEFITSSEMALLRYSDMQYFNRFVLTRPDGESRGMAVGRFLSDGSKFTPNIYEGSVMFFDEGIFRRQVAYRIDNSEIRKAKKANKRNWREEILNNNQG